MKEDVSTIVKGPPAVVVTAPLMTKFVSVSTIPDEVFVLRAPLNVVVPLPAD